MTSGIDLATTDDPELGALLHNMKDQLLIVMINRLGGSVDIPVSEIDDSGEFICMMRIDNGNSFHFEVSKKS